MLKIKDLNLGLMDATNYVKSKDFFNNIFFVDDFVDQILRDEIYFIVGDKGTGKTAYGLYFQNNEIDNTLSSIILDISSSDITKFKKMIDERQLLYSSLKDMWELILYVEMSKFLIKHKSFSYSMQCSLTQKKLENAIGLYEKLALNPDVVSTTNTRHGGEIKAEMPFVSPSLSKEVSTTRNEIHHNISRLLGVFEDCFQSLEINKNMLLFVDGIDIIPYPFDQESYVLYLVDLINASLRLNQEIFSNIKSKNTNLKVMLLLRPDVFQLTASIKNWNIKKHDNAVNLNWVPQKGDIKNSRLFKVIDKLLSTQQDKTNIETTCVDYYFQQEKNTLETHFSFDYILDYTFLRPRDVIFILKKMKEIIIKEELDASHFEEYHFNKSYANYCEYLYDDLKEQLLLRYTNDDFEKLRIFFSFLSRTKFSTVEYNRAFKNYCNYLEKEKSILPVFASTSATLLDFLYKQNIIGFRKKGSDEEYKWYFIEKERCAVNQIVMKSNSEYCIHKGLENIANAAMASARSKK